MTLILILFLFMEHIIHMYLFDNDTKLKFTRLLFDIWLVLKVAFCKMFFSMTHDQVVAIFVLGYLRTLECHLWVQ